MADSHCTYPPLQNSTPPYKAVKGFYINGINTSCDKAYVTLKDIRDLTNDQYVDVHHNQTFSQKKISELKTSIASALITSLPVALGMAETKAAIEASAASLKTKIEKSLTDLAFSRVVLFAHSQGADIAHKAFNQLSLELRERVNIITLGGMIAIDGAENFVYERRDPIQNVQAFFSPGGTYIRLYPPKLEEAKLKKEAGIIEYRHGVTGYLAHPKIVKALEDALRPGE